MTDFRATFTAGTRTRTVTFKVDTVQTREQLERMAWGRLRHATSLPADNWTLACLDRLLYQDAADEDGRS